LIFLWLLHTGNIATEWPNVAYRASKVECHPFAARQITMIGNRRILCAGVIICVMRYARICALNMRAVKFNLT